MPIIYDILYREILVYRANIHDLRMYWPRQLREYVSQIAIQEYKKTCIT